jgi:hypothetical protein
VSGCLDWKNFEAPGNLKDPEKIAAAIAEKQASAYAKTSFDGGWGWVCVIGAAIDDMPGLCRIAETPDREADLLGSFFHGISQDTGQQSRIVVCGHNVAYDLAFLKKRCIVHGIELPRWWPHGAKPWDGRIRDTMKLWDDRYGEMTGLDELCRILGVEGKDGFDGSMVAEAWANGEYGKVAEYCAADVERVREINNRFVAVGL